MNNEKKKCAVCGSPVRIEKNDQGQLFEVCDVRPDIKHSRADGRYDLIRVKSFRYISET